MLKNTFTSTSFTFNELIRKILLAILFLTPLISERLFLSSLNLIQILILCASLLWLLSRKFFAQKFSIPDKALIVFVSMSIISIFVSSYLNTTFYEVKKILYYFLIYVIVSDLFNDFNSVKRINFIIIFTGIFVALYGLYQYFYGFADTLKSIDWKSISDVGEIQKNLIAKRIFSTFLYPNSLAGYFIMIIPIAISSVLTEKHSYLKVFYIILTAIFVFALYLTHSVAGWFAFFCTIIFFILLNNLYGKTGKIKPLFLLIISIIFLVGGIFILKERIDVFKDIHSPANSVIARLHYWKSALVLMMDSPFLGKGLGTYGAEFLNLKSEKIFYAQYAHNFYLQLGAEVGILGMFSFIVFAVYAIFKAIKRLNTVSLPQHYIALISACFGFLVHNFFDFDAYLWELSFIWWVMMAIIYPISGLKSLSNSFNLKLKKDWLLNFLLYFLLFFAPFLQGGKTPLALTIINLSILLLAYLVLKTKEEIKISSISLPLLVFLVWVSFSAFYSVHKYASLAQIVQIYIYVLFYYVIINSSFVVADLSAKKIADKSATTVNLFYVIIGSSVIVSIWGISEFLFFNKVRISACFPNPNLLAGYIVSAIGLAINFLLYNDKTKKSEKLIAIVLLIVSLPALFLTKSRGGFLALFIVLLITLAGMLLVKQKRKILLIILICFVVFSAIVIPQLLNRMNTDPFAYGRISIWKSTIEMIKDKMLIGWGIGTYEDVFPKYNFPVDGCIARYGRFANFAHSEPLQLAAETGILGILCIIWIFMLFGKNIISQVAAGFSLRYFTLFGFLSVFAGIFTQSIVDFNLHLPSIALLFILSMGLLSKDIKTIHIPDLNEKKWWQSSAGRLKAYFSFFILVLFLMTLQNYFAGVFSLKAEKYIVHGDFNKSISMYRNAILLDPLNPKYHDELGKLYANDFYKSRNDLSFKYSEKEFLKAIKFNRADGFYRKHLANLYANTSLLVNNKDLEDAAIESYKEAIELRPYDPFIIFELASFYEANKKYLDAIVLYKQAVAIEPNYILAHYNLSGLYKKSGNKKDAIAEYETVAKLRQKYSTKDAISNYEKRLIDSYFSVKIK